MRFRWIASLLLLPFLQGCVKHYPQESDIAGTWEGISLVYVLIDYESADKAYIVAGNVADADNEFLAGRLSNFVSRENDFTLDYAGMVDGKAETGTMIGQVYGSRILLRFIEMEEPETQESAAAFVWLMKSEELDASRIAARTALDDFLRTDGPP